MMGALFREPMLRREAVSWPAGKGCQTAPGRSRSSEGGRVVAPSERQARLRARSSGCVPKTAVPPAEIWCSLPSICTDRRNHLSGDSELMHRLVPRRESEVSTPVLLSVSAGQIGSFRLQYSFPLMFDRVCLYSLCRAAVCCVRAVEPLRER
ncbi:unnamed protein product [Ectocarpus sp. 13 AM-2016]